MITHILAHCNGTEWWLIPPGHPLARERYSTKDQKTFQHPQNRLCHKDKSMFWPFILNQTSPDWLHGWTDILVEPVRTVCHCPELTKCVFMAWSSNNDLPSLWIMKPFFQALRSPLILGGASSAGGKVFRFRSSQSALCTTAVGSKGLYWRFDSL